MTSALTAAQKGTAVSFPLGSTAPVLMSTGTGTAVKLAFAANNNPANSVSGLSTDGSANFGDGSANLLKINPNGQLYTDLASPLARLSIRFVCP